MDKVERARAEREAIAMMVAAENGEHPHTYPVADLARLLRDTVVTVLMCEAEPHVIADAIGIVQQAADRIDTLSQPLIAERGREALPTEMLERAWTDFLDANPDDLNSPEDLPNHALVTCDQMVSGLCEDCPPADYPTDKTRCDPCPRRSTPPAPDLREAVGRIVDPEAFRTLREIAAAAGLDAENPPAGVVLLDPIDGPRKAFQARYDAALIKADAILSLLRPSASKGVVEAAREIIAIDDANERDLGLLRQTHANGIKGGIRWAAGLLRDALSNEGAGSDG